MKWYFSICLLIFLNCANYPKTWMGIPIPEGGRIKEISDKDVVGKQYGKYVELIIGDFENLEKIYDFYEEKLGDMWKQCPFSYSNREDFSREFHWRYAMWANKNEKSFFTVATNKKMTSLPKNKLDPKEIVIGFDHDPKAWNYLYWGSCNPRDASLIHPLMLNRLRHYCYSDMENVEFISDKWKRGDSNIRGKMLSDLICRGDLIGVGENDILELLGKPDKISADSFSYKIQKMDGFWKKFWAPPPPPPRGKSNAQKVGMNWALHLIFRRVLHLEAECPLE